MKRLLQIIALVLAISAVTQTVREVLKGGVIPNAYADRDHEPGV